MLFLELNWRFDFPGLRILGVLCAQAPLLIVALVGLLLALLRWHKSRRAPVLILLALGLVVAKAAIVTIWLSDLAQRNLIPTADNLQKREAIRALLDAGIWALVLCALFGSPSRSVPAPPSEPIADPESGRRPARGGRPPTTSRGR